MKPAFLADTICPHCQDVGFAPMRAEHEVIQSSLSVEPAGERPGIVVGGPMLTVVFKVCHACGFVGMFAHTLVK